MLLLLCCCCSFLLWACCLFLPFRFEEAFVRHEKCARCNNPSVAEKQQGQEEESSWLGVLAGGDGAEEHYGRGGTALDVAGGGDARCAVQQMAKKTAVLTSDKREEGEGVTGGAGCGFENSIYLSRKFEYLSLYGKYYFFGVSELLYSCT